MSADTTPIMQRRLAKFREAETEIYIFLKNGIRLSGKVVEFDNWSIVLTSRKNNQNSESIVERSAVATVLPYIAGESR